MHRPAGAVWQFAKVGQRGLAACVSLTAVHGDRAGVYYLTYCPLLCYDSQRASSVWRRIAMAMLDASLCLLLASLIQPRALHCVG
jgi:hypothetical protein